MKRALPPITNAQTLMHIAYNVHFLLMQVLYCVLHMLHMALCTLMPLLTTSTWLFISMYATAVSIHTAVSENRQPSKCVHSPRVLQTCVILVSLLSATANLTMFILTQVHCMLTLAAAYSFLTQPHWISACLIMLYAPEAIEKLTTRLTYVIEYAIQSLVKNLKQFKFAHPRIRNGTYWRRIRNRTRQLRKQPVYKYIKVLCWLHHFIQHATPQQTKYSDEHASKPDNEHHTHMQGEAKCDKTGDRNAATQHNTDQHRDTHCHRGRAAHHRRSESALIRRQNRTKQRKLASTEARFTTQPCLRGTHDAQVTCAVPIKVLCVDAPNCCSHALSYSEMNYSGTTHLNTEREETIVPRHTYRGGAKQMHIPDGEPDLGPNNNLYTPVVPISGSGHEWLSSNHILKCVLYMLHMRYPDAKHQNTTLRRHSHS